MATVYIRINHELWLVDAAFQDRSHPSPSFFCFVSLSLVSIQYLLLIARLGDWLVQMPLFLFICYFRRGPHNVKLPTLYFHHRDRLKSSQSPAHFFCPHYPVFVFTPSPLLYPYFRYRVDLSSVKRGSRAIVGRRGGGGAPPRGKISAFPENKKAVVAGGGGRVGVEVGVESPGEKRRRVIPDGRGGFKIAAKTVTTAITLGRGGNGGGRGGVLSTASDDAEFPPLVSSSSLLSFRQRRSGSGITSNEGRAPKRPSKNYWLGAEKGAAAAIAAAAAARAAATEEKETPTIYDSEATGGSGGREREKGSLYDNVGIINSKKGYTKKENRREKGQGQAASSFKANPAGKGQGQGQQPRQKAQQAKGSQVQKSLEELMSGGLTSSRR